MGLPDVAELERLANGAGRDPRAVDRLSAEECLALLATLGWTTTQVVARLTRLTQSAVPTAPVLTPGRMLTAEEVAVRLGRKVSYVRELLRAGELPGVRPPGRKYWLVSEAALIGWQQTLDTQGAGARYSDPTLASTGA
jgi:excisionase family DNA binding protein